MELRVQIAPYVRQLAVEQYVGIRRRVAAEAAKKKENISLGGQH